MKAAILLSLLTVLGSSLAHPGEDHTAEALERRDALNLVGARSLAHCSNSLAARGVAKRNQLRRRAFLDQAQAQNNLKKRDTASVLATDHKSNLTGVTTQTDPSELFKGDSNACVLAPEVTEGPYFVQGELIRQDVRESQPGVPLYIDVQLIDTNTCEPIEGAALDFWHCNSTGVYSGVVANGNGASGLEETLLNQTYLRGIQETSSDGVAQFISVFPGHYTGRSQHIHVMAHGPGKWERQANNTITGNTLNSHVGQIFFDVDLVKQVEQLAPYNTNTQTLMTTDQDMIFAQEAAEIDPIAEYVLLGDTLEEGIFAWISIAVNSSAEHTAHAAANYSSEGGAMNSGGFGGPGGGAGGPPPGFNGTFPSGFPGGNGSFPMPSGVPGGNGTQPPSGGVGSAVPPVSVSPSASEAPIASSTTEAPVASETASASASASASAGHGHGHSGHSNNGHSNNSHSNNGHGNNTHTTSSHGKGNANGHGHYYHHDHHAKGPHRHGHNHTEEDN